MNEEELHFFCSVAATVSHFRIMFLNLYVVECHRFCRSSPCVEQLAAAEALFEDSSTASDDDSEEDGGGARGEAEAFRRDPLEHLVRGDLTNAWERALEVEALFSRRPKSELFAGRHARWLQVRTLSPLRHFCGPP